MSKQSPNTLSPGSNQSIQDQDSPGSFSGCFRFADPQDFILFSLGIILAFINGACTSAYGLTMGLAVSTFDSRNSPELIQENSTLVTTYFLLLGLLIFLSTFGSRILLRINAQRQGYKLRMAYLRALLGRKASDYDRIDPVEVSSQVEGDCKTVTDSLDVQMESIVFAIGAFLSGLFIAFNRSWEISVMVIIAVPFILCSTFLYNDLMMKSPIKRAEAYEKAGNIAREALENITTVVSLGGEKQEVQRYERSLNETQGIMSRLGFFQGMAFGSFELVFYVLLAVIFYVGSYYIEEEKVNTITGAPFVLADIFAPVAAITVGCTQVPVLVANLKGLHGAKVKIRRILNIIDSSVQGRSSYRIIQNFNGAIKFNNVSFSYPGTPAKTTLQNLNFTIVPHSKVVIVGDQGSEKSAILQLLQGFYEAQRGFIELDDINIRNLDQSWLRRNVTYIGSEPVLFSMSIKENLLLGKEDASEDEMIQVLKSLNAYDFIVGLPMKLDTQVKGNYLTESQKQRIAIARGLLRDSKVLLLDEVGKKLDRVSEKEVQRAVEGHRGEKTIIVVTQRVSEIEETDQVIVLDQGRVVEMGNHSELLEKNGKYCEILETQRRSYKKREVESAMNEVDRLDASLSEEKAEVVDQVEVEEESNEEQYLIMRESSVPVHFDERNTVKSEPAKPEVTRKELNSLWKQTKHNVKLLVAAIVATVVNSIYIPLTHILIAGAFSVLINSKDTDLRSNVNLFCVLILISGVVIFLFYVIEIGLFTKTSEYFIKSLRIHLLYKFLKMHMAWHDEPENSPENLASSLEMDTANLGQLTGVSVGLFIQIIMTNIVTLIIAYISCWQMGLIGTLVFPFMCIVAFKLSSNESRGERNGTALIQKAEFVVMEALCNLRTIASLNAEKKVLDDYASAINELQLLRLKIRINNGLLEGGVYILFYFVLAFMYYVGTSLYFSQNLSPMRIFLPVFGLAVTTFFSTQIFFLVPELGTAIDPVKTMLDYLETDSKIDIEDKKTVYKGKIEGNIEFKGIGFSYPATGKVIFQNLSFKIGAGTQIGLTGPSECGKSTIMKLLLRLYDVDKGEILLEGINIKEYDIQYLRKRIGVVLEEPVLFNETIAYNLSYGNEEVTELEMREAAKKANALKFIEINSSLKRKDNEPKELMSPQTASLGFQRYVGPHGNQLSEGQKQRIAIARVVLRKPKVLFYDEATSGMDLQSEGMVQDALSKAAEGLTTIWVSDRAGNMGDVEEIMVIKNGEIEGKGRYEEINGMEKEE